MYGLPELQFVYRILLEQRQVLGSVNSTDEVPDAMDGTEFTAWIKHHLIAQWTIFLVMATTLEQLYSSQKVAKALWNQLKEDYKSKVKVNVESLQDDMSAVRLGDCEYVQDYAS
jgi:hypothetical protein